jgi:hypothetical protein
MKEINNEKDLLTKVLILAIYNKPEKVTIEDILTELDATGAIMKNESKEILEKLAENKLFINGEFTSAGKMQVEKAQKFFQR